jgi:hypothetical protein
MGSRRRSRKSDGDLAFGVVVLLAIGVFIYPKALYYILGTIVVIAVVIVAIYIFRRKDVAAAGRNGSIRASNSVEVTNGGSGTDLYGIWKSIGGANVRVIDHKRWTMGLLRALEWKRFEIVCGKYFEMCGFVAKTNRCGPDGGVDIHLFKDGSQRPDVAVQCKAWSTYKVGVKTVRELLGVMTADRINQGTLITTGLYTNEARQFAQGKEIELIDGEGLLQRIESLTSEQKAELLTVATEGDYTTPTCPSCGIKMTLRTNSKDESQFWGCLNYPRCHARLRYSKVSI